MACFFRLRNPLILAFGVFAGAGLLFHPPPVLSRTVIEADQGLPSSISANYGEAVPLGERSVAGPYLIPTGNGFEVRDAAAGGAPIGTFRTPGSINAATFDGTTAYLFAGPRGILAVDLSNPAQPMPIGSLAGIGSVSLGAASPNGYGLAALSDQGLLFIGRSSPGAMQPLATRTFADGRLVIGVRARADSFLVVSSRAFPVQRVIVTLYRLPAAASEPESLKEITIPLERPTSVAWRGDVAFIGIENDGVEVVNIRTGAHHAFRLPGNAYVRAVDANDSVVVAATQASGLARIRRSGAAGDSLVNATLEALTFDPFQVTLVGTRIVLASRDVELAQEPDEVGFSMIEFRDLAGPTPFPTEGGTGRTRRVVTQGGLAYVADYTGGLRIYHAGLADTSLVGVLAPPPAGRAVDIAVDGQHHRAYLAMSSAGLEIVDVSNPASPSALATLPLPEQVSAVAIADSNLVIVGRRGNASAGLTLVDVSNPSAPVARGQIGPGFLPDPRAIAVKDTVAYVADASVGLTSVGFGNPDAPEVIGISSGFGALDLDLAGTRLLVATRSDGLEVVDVFNPAIPTLRSSVHLPTVLGVTQAANSAIAFLDGEEAAVLDMTDPFVPSYRGPIAVPGIARDGSWSGDTLLVAAGLALERYRVNPVPVTPPALTITFDAEQVQPRAHIAWSPVNLAGLAGLHVYRDVISAAGVPSPMGSPVNADLLAPTTTSFVDPLVPSGARLRYRLEALLTDGSIRTVAEGFADIPSNPDLGRPYPNPYRPAAGILSVPFRIGAGTSASMELRVYDASGRLVRSIAQAGPAGGGFGSIAWDGRDAHGQHVPDGVYFLRLEGGGIDDSRQIILLR